MSKPEYDHGYADGVEWATRAYDPLWAVYQEVIDLWEAFEPRLRSSIGETQFVLMREKLLKVGTLKNQEALHAPLMEQRDHRGKQWPIGGCQCKACLSTAVNLSHSS